MLAAINPVAKLLNSVTSDPLVAMLALAVLAIVFAPNLLGSLGSVKAIIPRTDSADDVVRKRVSDIKEACPGAPSDEVLKWTEKGMNTERAKDAYIAVLTGKKDSTV